MKNEICCRIKEIRHSLGMNKHEFAKFLEITPQYLGSVENCENCFSVEKIILLSKKANISTDYILLGKREIINEQIIQNIMGLNSTQLNDCYSIINALVDLIQKLK